MLEYLLLTYHYKLEQSSTEEKCHQFSNILFEFIRNHQIDIYVSEEELMEYSV